MSQNIKQFFLSLWAKKMTREIKELYASDLILNFASSALLIFEPIYLYFLFIPDHTLGRTLQYVLFFYFGVYVLYLFAVPLGAKLARKIGYEYSMAVSLVFTVLFYLALFGIKYYFDLFWLAILLYVISKFLYWPAYHGDFARFSSKGNHGRQVSGLVALRSIVLICGPLVGGLVLNFFGFGAMFGLFSILIISASIPLLTTKENFKPVEFSYREAFKRLFSKENRRRFFCFLGFGEELIAMVIWPIFIYVAMPNFFQLGAFLTVSTALTTVLFLLIGRASDYGGRCSVHYSGVALYFFTWLFRVIARSLGGVFLVDVSGRLAKEMIIIPSMAKIYQEAQDGSVMNEVVFFEMSLVVGKIIAIILSIILLQIFAPGWNVLFILAGLFSLLYSLFKFHD